jgi:hypothetical protein
MGSLHYGSPPATFELDDRALAHVELVVLAKLRRNESFALGLDVPDGGRTTIWINSASTLRFEFTEATHEINREWLEELIDSANTTAGMRVLPEPAKVPAAS